MRHNTTVKGTTRNVPSLGKARKHGAAPLMSNLIYQWLNGRPLIDLKTGTVYTVLELQDVLPAGTVDILTLDQKPEAESARSIRTLVELPFLTLDDLATPEASARYHLLSSLHPHMREHTVNQLNETSKLVRALITANPDRALNTLADVAHWLDVRYADVFSSATDAPEAKRDPANDFPMEMEIPEPFRDRVVGYPDSTGRGHFALLLPSQQRPIPLRAVILNSGACCFALPIGASRYPEAQLRHFWMDNHELAELQAAFEKKTVIRATEPLSGDCITAHARGSNLALTIISAREARHFRQNMDSIRLAKQLDPLGPLTRPLAKEDQFGANLVATTLSQELIGEVCAPTLEGTSCRQTNCVAPSIPPR